MIRPLILALVACLAGLGAAELPKLANPELTLDPAGTLPGWTVRGEHDVAHAVWPGVWFRSVFRRILGRGSLS